ncbi:M24 family metallopeptidase [Nonomuraea dietziae]|uniref:M24 family metallopeptidase n=1 Tax=Nonomuraea dietziae TaxID=65515 RepID=UPI003F4D2CF0
MAEPFAALALVWGQRGSHAVICASVNDVIVHGIPDGYRLQEGDLLSVDCGAYLDGWAADAAVSVVIPQDPDPCGRRG